MVVRWKVSNICLPFVWRKFSKKKRLTYIYTRRGLDYSWTLGRLGTQCVILTSFDDRSSFKISTWLRCLLTRRSRGSPPYPDYHDDPIHENGMWSWRRFLSRETVKPSTTRVSRKTSRVMKWPSVGSSLKCLFLYPMNLPGEGKDPRQRTIHFSYPPPLLPVVLKFHGDRLGFWLHWRDIPLTDCPGVLTL